MATKEDVVYYLESTYNYEHLSDILLKVEYPRSNGRNQWVYVGISDKLIYFYSYFANLADYTPNQLLPIASQESYYGTQIVGDKYCLVNVIEYSNLITSDLYVQIGTLAVSADELEQFLNSRDSF
jgi:hypothetical protein